MLFKKLSHIYAAVKGKLVRAKQQKYSKTVGKRIEECGKNLQVWGPIDLINPGNITMGNDCSLNHGVYINAYNHIKIGSDVTLSAGAKVISTGIDYVSWAAGKKQHNVNQGITIGDHVWVGANAMILGDVTISGQYVVIAAGAVVTKDIHQSRCIVAGCPAKVISTF